MKQASLFQRERPFHGGGIVCGRKTARPFAPKAPLHLVLKSRRRIFYGDRSFIENKVRIFAERFQLKIYSMAVNHDHLHFALLFRFKEDYRKFIRALTGLLASRWGAGLFSLLPF